MVGSIASSPAIDLSGLPAPVVIAQPDFETRLAAKIARLVVLHPAFDALVESDPAIKLLEADSYDEMVLAQAFNDAASGLLLAFATGPRLDHIAALFDIARMTVAPANPATNTPAVMESDTALRQRVQLAPHRFSVAGPELAYVFHARSAHPDVLDATAISPSPGQVVVTVLSASGTGVPNADVLQAVRTRLTGPVRPLTDEVIVQPVELVDFDIRARIFVFAGPDENLILQTARNALDTHLATVRRVDRDIACSAIVAALHVANVQRVELLSPVADIAISPGQIGRVTSIDVSVAGTEI